MSLLTSYLHDVQAAHASGQATEHSYRPALKTLLESLMPGAQATNEPKRQKCGAPDFIVTRGQTPLGYLETKTPGEPLDKVAQGEQMERYRKALGNLILTDYLEFHWYVGGQHRDTARLAAVGKGQKLSPEADGPARVEGLLRAFLETQTPTAATPKELAQRMASLAKLIRDAIRRALEGEDKGGGLHQQMEGFRKTLLHDLSGEQFADMYAQTICYGLFAARCNVKPGVRFTREHAAYDLPKTNPFLRKMFGHIAGPDLDERITWAVDDLAELLNRADMSAILADFGKRTRQEDPVVHFYETFLAAYDPKMREARGVYYTPEPVVSYIVRSVDHLLKTDFGLPDGLADAQKITVKTPDGKGTAEVHKVQILDPATGTGTFLHGVIDAVHEKFAGNKGKWSGYVAQHLLPRLFGFELLMAPYAVAHMKLGLQLKETGYDFGSDERLGVFLTNTLEEANQIAGMTLFAQWVVEEANAAGRVKQEAPVMVILGNPPYSGHSANKGEWISGLINRYKEGCPELYKPAQAKWLSDDYVKFIRFAQWRIEQTGYGILAFISNHGYLDNPTFRGMRRFLMGTFDDIYILDLHGNSKKKETTPEGGKDENVFDIQQGVAIGILVKRPDPTQEAATVRHADLWGERESKYKWLLEHEAATTEWCELNPQQPHYLFARRETALLPEYEAGWKISEVFSLNGDPAPGIVTTQDEFAISWNADEAVAKVERFLKTDTEEEARQLFRLCSQNQWQYDRAKTELKKGTWRQEVTRLLYRPFDLRWTVFNSNVAVHRRERVSRHVLNDGNIALISTRQTRDHWDILATNHIMGHKSLAAYDINFQFPLYLYPSTMKAHLFDEEGGGSVGTRGGRKANLAPEFVEDMAGRLGMAFVPDGKGDRQSAFGPEDVFDYLYAVFHSPAYRSRYAEFLKIDFPRLPLTRDPDLFRQLCGLGAQLVGLHLMETQAAPQPDFPEAGSDRVETVRYAEPSQGVSQGRVYINASQYFSGVTPEVWNFHVGGYQVCQKWLKDRKGRTLSYDDITHYQRIVAALAETIRLMAAIDNAIDAHGGWPLG
ncbi:MAG: N-6 DNA methylase [Armatimonadetes bacterium]|nr:N-6 DNA methylase [Armatimonadota bacterium]